MAWPLTYVKYYDSGTSISLCIRHGLWVDSLTGLPTADCSYSQVHGNRIYRNKWYSALMTLRLNLQL